ncbi:MAG: DUF669 domain-containing protein [Planctomycetota bacterium]
MADLKGFNANNYEALENHDVLPPGEYPVAIVNSSLKSTKDLDGQYLELEFDVLDGKFKGRKLWDRMNIKHPSEKAVAFAQRKLASICRALGVLTPSDSSQLHNRPLVAQVRQRTRGDTGEVVSEIRRYSAVGQPAQSQAMVPPWSRG